MHSFTVGMCSAYLRVNSVRSWLMVRYVPDHTACPTSFVAVPMHMYMVMCRRQVMSYPISNVMKTAMHFGRVMLHVSDVIYTMIHHGNIKSYVSNDVIDVVLSRLVFPLQGPQLLWQISLSVKHSPIFSLTSHNYVAIGE